MDCVLDYALWISRVEAQRKSMRSEDHKKRLAERISLFGFKQLDVTGDGNCQFHAVVHQLRNNARKAKVPCDHTHVSLRADAVAWLRKNKFWNPSKQEGGELHYFVEENWDSYCNRVSRDGQWGDHITLIALAEILNVGIRIISSVEGDQFITEIDPFAAAGKETSMGRAHVLFLGHWCEYHYTTLEEDGDMLMTISSLKSAPPAALEAVRNPEMSLSMYCSTLLTPEPGASSASSSSSSSSSSQSEGANPLTVSAEIEQITTHSSSSSLIPPPSPSDRSHSQPSPSPSPTPFAVPAASQEKRKVLKIRNAIRGEIRRVAVPNWPSVVELHRLIATLFTNVPDVYYVQYLDPSDNTHVTVASQRELEEFTSTLPEYGVFSVEVGLCEGEKSGLNSAAVRLHQERRNLH